MIRLILYFLVPIAWYCYPDLGVVMFIICLLVLRYIWKRLFARRSTGRAQPIPQEADPARGRWTHIAAHLITGFPPTTYRNQPVNAILTIVDEASSRVHLYPVSAESSAQAMIDILVYDYFPLHGLPSSIQTDRAPPFTGEMFQSAMALLRIDSHPSVACPTPADGGVEDRNKQIEAFLRLYVHHRFEWPFLLAVGEYVLNAQPSLSLKGKSPFEVDLGYLPKAPAGFDLPAPARTLHQTFIDITGHLDRTLHTALAAYRESFDKAKTHDDLKHKDLCFEVGQQVYLDINCLTGLADLPECTSSSEVRSKLAGPFEIAQVKSPVHFEVVMPPKLNRGQVYFTPPPPPTDTGVKDYRDDSQLESFIEIVGHKRFGRGYRLFARCMPSADYPKGDIIPIGAFYVRRVAPNAYRAYARIHGLPFAY